MARAGRKLKAGVRTASGALKKPTKEERANAQRAAEESEMIVVLRQPHRLGSRSQRRISALGRFIEDNKLRDELFLAGEQYAATRRKWLAAKGAPLPDKLGGNGGDIPDELVQRWKAEIDRAEDGVCACSELLHDPYVNGISALGCITYLCFEDKDLPGPAYHRDTIAGLMALAVALGRLDLRELAKMGAAR